MAIGYLYNAAGTQLPGRTMIAGNAVRVRGVMTKRWIVTDTTGITARVHTGTNGIFSVDTADLIVQRTN